MLRLIKIADTFPTQKVWIYDGKIKQECLDGLLKNKNVVIFSNPGVFFVSYIASQIINYEYNYQKIKNFNVDEIYCLVSNDPFTVANYCEKYNIKNIKFICDIDNSLLEKTGYLYNFTDIGLGFRPWPFSCFIKNKIIYKIFYEDFSVMPIDCYSQTSSITLLNYLKNHEN